MHANVATDHDFAFLPSDSSNSSNSSTRPTFSAATALMHAHNHEGPSERARHLHGDSDETDERKSKQIGKMMQPYLAQHIPQQYNPIGAAHNPPGATANTKYCYRHRPDLLCRQPADEPSMEQLQLKLMKESQADQQSIANVWSLFSAAPAAHRNLMLQGLLAQCCFPQLSFIASSVRNLIKIDFLGALPTELGFKILCYLDTTSLCNAARVSRRWRTLADDDVVWHRMCEQHIDRKCTKCGWGLPLLDQARLRQDKRRMQMRASGGISPTPGSAPSSLVERTSDVFISPAGTKRPAPDEAGESSEASKRHKRPWKDVYKDRYKVGTNWKYGRYQTRIFKGHTNGVMCLQFNNHVIITGSYDATAKVWDIKTGEVLRTLRGHTQGIRCLQFDDCNLVTGSLDGSIKMWNWRTGELLKTMRVHSGGVIGLHLADTLLASGSSDHTIVVHDAGEKKERIRLQGHTDWVNCVKIDLDSRTLLSASDDMTVKLWDLNNHVCLKTYEGHVGQVQQVLPLPRDFEIDEADFAAHANNDFSDIASLASHARSASPIAAPSSQDVSFFPGQTNEDGSPRANPPSYMLTGALDGTIRLTHIPSGRCVHTFFGHVEGIWSLAADRLRMASGAEDKTLKIWDPSTGQCERTLTGHTGPVTCVGLSDERVVSGSEDGTVRVHCFV